MRHESFLIPLLDFTPVPRRRRRADGWTPDRQRLFIAALAEGGSVTAAAARVGMSHATAYDLYNHEEGGSFRDAWERALQIGVGRVRDGAIERAINGVPIPIYYKGEQVGTRPYFNEFLTSLILRHRDSGFAGNPSPVGQRRGPADKAAREQEERAAYRERVEQDRASGEAIVARLDNIRGHFLAACVGDPARRAAWELLRGPMDWTQVRGWRPDTPTPCVDENMTKPSMTVTLGEVIGDDGERVADRLFAMPDEEAPI